jgi:predicted enzyme related to lactoylglutathione lyase
MIDNAKYVHTNIIAKDWEKLAIFYEEVFGCRRILPERNLSGEWIDDATELKDIHIRGAHLLLPGYSDPYPTLEIFQYDRFEENKNKRINASGFGHLAFLVDDVETALREVESHGGSRIGKIVRHEIPGVSLLTFVYARDPEGNFIELQNWKK